MAEPVQGIIRGDSLKGGPDALDQGVPSSSCTGTHASLGFRPSVLDRVEIGRIRGQKFEARPARTDVNADFDVLMIPRLSQITMSPGLSSGARWLRVHSRIASVFIAPGSGAWTPSTLSAAITEYVSQRRLRT